MRRFAVLLVHCVALGALTGCQYGPLDLEENQPQISDAYIERDFVVSGTSLLAYRENSDGIGQLICVVEQEVEGWRDDTLKDSDCVGCEAIYTLSFRTIDAGDCEFGGPVSADVAITEVSIVEQVDGDFHDWLVDNQADAHAHSTWEPRGTTAWEPRFGAYRIETPTSPESQQPWECGADWCMQSRWWFGTTDWYARWWLAVDFDE